ncbi:phosphatase PAP2 family protein [Dactylosporangium aurantiacum]|uniref:Phosphatase PAP2 family protein n=1 Tax=Dactylosporangium aurantiacum TaxID=35754 RepID=A0A9Q9IHV9_9ACTN|nr:phosphatase PAP2 family protein [Dactylosporangium aurantiacum]MDG6105999.1 phosphatase PAP2 family protein [Dactylosporangium aurantiacum]UWZ55951.1 phosphatase PAP2 family protein [Dactylosporangium aurantiacum]
MRTQRSALWRMAGFGGAALLFSILIIAVRVRWVPLESVDRGIAEELNEAVAPSDFLVTLMGGISRLGSFGVMAWLVVIGTTLVLVRKQYKLAGFLVATTVGGLILDPTLKLAVGRLRPVVEQPVAHGGGNSFPSGHSLNSLICYTALLLVFLPALRPRWRRAAVIGVGAIVLLVGFSRLALGVHFLSDVIGGWSLGIAWIGLCATAFELLRAHEGRRVTEPLEEGLEPEAADDLRPTEPHEHRSGTARALALGAVAWVFTFGALVVVGLPLARYEDGNGNILWDTTIPHWFAANRSDVLGHVSIVGSEVGNTHAILAIGLAIGAVSLAAIRRWRPVIFLLTVMFGELSLFLASAAIVDRARPDVENMDGPMPTSSFPSGHVAATILIWATAAVLVMPRTRAWWRWAFLALAVAMPAWVAVSRMYRGMHHPTDIVGSALLSALWLGAAYWLVKPNCDLAEQPCEEDAPEPVSDLEDAKAAR